MKQTLSILFFLVSILLSAQDKGNDNQLQTQLKVQQAIQRKAEYHRLTNGKRDGHRIKIHFGVERNAAELVRTKFTKSFPDFSTDIEYQQPNFVILVGDYKSKLEAFESLKKVQSEFPNAFIVKGKISIK